MTGIALENCTVGTVSSREDGSVAFRVITAELRPSERGVVMDYHGKACAVTILPHEGPPPEMVRVRTEQQHKTPGQRLRAVLYVLYEHQKPGGDFETWYGRHMEALINTVKTQLP